MNALDMLVANKAKSDLQKQEDLNMMQAAFSSRIDMKNDEKAVRLDDEASLFFELQVKAHNLARELDAAKQDFAPFVELCKSKGIVARRAKAKDFNAEVEEQSHIADAQIQNIAKILSEMDAEDIDRDVKVSIATTILFPIWASHTFWSKELTNMEASLVATKAALKPRVLELWHSKCSPLIFGTELFTGLDAFIEMLIEDQQRFIEESPLRAQEYALRKQERAAKAQASRIKRANERREAKRLEAKAVIGDGKQELKPAHVEVESIGTPAFSMAKGFAKFKGSLPKQG